MGIKFRDKMPEYSYKRLPFINHADNEKYNSVVCLRRNFYLIWTKVHRNKILRLNSSLKAGLIKFDDEGALAQNLI